MAYIFISACDTHIKVHGVYVHGTIMHRIGILQFHKNAHFFLFFFSLFRIENFYGYVYL